MDMSGVRGREGTFYLNKKEAIHRWFAYMEGYSGILVEKELERIGYDRVHTLYDPFGGCGTSLLTASRHHMIPFYSEVNPFMGFVCDVKINHVIHIRESAQKRQLLREHYRYVSGLGLAACPVSDYQGFEKFYDASRLSVLLQILAVIGEIEDEDVKNVCLVAIASIAVQVSKMVRRGDLRYAKGNEKEGVNQNVKEVYLEKLRQVIQDIEDEGAGLFTEVTKISDDARDVRGSNLFDCVITSPPYLNGTNYIRNTKLELKLLGFVGSEKDLPPLHSKGIMAGINSVSKRNHVEILPCVKPYLDELEPVAYDKRISVMVAGYFYDMDRVIRSLGETVKPSGSFIMDIGDSAFSGVHIPTHVLLERIAISHGFEKYGEEVLRVRHSKNGTKLSQRVLRFRNAKET